MQLRRLGNGESVVLLSRERSVERMGADQRHLCHLLRIVYFCASHENVRIRRVRLPLHWRDDHYWSVQSHAVSLGHSLLHRLLGDDQPEYGRQVLRNDRHCRSAVRLLHYSQRRHLGHLGLVGGQLRHGTVRSVRHAESITNLHSRPHHRMSLHW